MTSLGQKAALADLDRYIECAYPMSIASACTLKAMLAAPRMPQRPVVDCYPTTEGYTMPEWDAVTDAISHYHHALYAHLTKPATKTVEVWRVEWASEGGDARCFVYPDRRKADDWAEYLRKSGRACIHVTGPHKQEVPA